MIRLLTISALVSAAFAASCEEVTTTLELPGTDYNTSVVYSICPDANVITSKVVGTEIFQTATAYEDYDVGFGATRDSEKEECLVHKLQASTLEEQAAVLRSQSTQTVQTTGNLNLIKVPEDEPASEFGQRIANFCGDFPVFKVGTDNEGTRVVPFEQEDRAITFTFKKCLLWRFFLFYTCFTTTLTIPTGTTITFVWFFG